ncbi:hypothetical protein TUM4438_10240 [Shewanella sairae]|uniref:DUF3275 family protein n=1 Tax=Shewanella sairae TaxID=190310 RepID=A0ABQ4P5R1_9GAMM|nr:DUF3275 family protein [Shewanella sairae]MCL1130458.1 DUF3275 family protein [Shewanella sairae]GIU42812.1 hypothetical protein TUM4438_10240 [Shewanella sairae]
MIQVPGTLTVKTIHGRFGAFNVAQLDLDVGRFTVKDALLEEYSEGVYQGTFAVKRIFAGSYQSGNRFTIETRAELSQIWLDYDVSYVEVDESTNIESFTPEPETDLEVATIRTEEVLQSPPPIAVSGDDDIGPTLFGELWPLGKAIRLDCTNRQQMRAQITYLKEKRHNGQPLWEFKSQDKTWVKLFDV